MCIFHKGNTNFKLELYVFTEISEGRIRNTVGVSTIFCSKDWMPVYNDHLQQGLDSSVCTSGH
jgi:hypothetical protein